MKKMVKVWSLIVVSFAVAAILQPAYAGFYIENGTLLDANGNAFVMRGVNHAHTWYQNNTGSIGDIKNAGANAVRVVLSNGKRWNKNSASDVANIIRLCKQNRLVCILEVHDTTGYGEQGGACTLDEAASYWIEIRNVLNGEEDYVIINIGNEPFGNNGAERNWVNHSQNAIRRLRDAGFDHTIMIDAPNWGQDWSFTMRDNARAVFNSDPDRNTIFSIHMYGVFDTAAEIDNYLSTFVNARLPLAVGEFGHDHSDGNPDEDAILKLCEQKQIGYLGWSWSGNGGGVEYLDMVNGFNANSFTSWGTRLFNGADGIKQTARECSVFGGISRPPATVNQPVTEQPVTSCGSPVVAMNDRADFETASAMTISGNILLIFLPGLLVIVSRGIRKIRRK